MPTPRHPRTLRLLKEGVGVLGTRLLVLHAVLTSDMLEFKMGGAG